MSQKNPTLQTQIREIRAKYPQPYPADAYAFISAAVRYTMEKLEAHRHVTARELLEGIRDLAGDSYGPVGGDVLYHWYIRHGRDAGEIVYRMIEFGALSASADDQKSDFDQDFDFNTDVQCQGGLRDLPKID